jgi:hypothetical protein
MIKRARARSLSYSNRPIIYYIIFSIDPACLLSSSSWRPPFSSLASSPLASHAHPPRFHTDLTVSCATAHLYQTSSIMRSRSLPFPDTTNDKFWPEFGYLNKFCYLTSLLVVAATWCNLISNRNKNDRYTLTERTYTHLQVLHWILLLLTR